MHRIAEAPLEIVYSLLKAWFPGRHPLGFWIFPSVETLQPLWATCYSVWPPSQSECCFMYLSAISCISVCVHCLPSCHWMLHSSVMVHISPLWPYCLFFPVFFFLLYLQLKFNFSSDLHIRSNKEELIYSNTESGIKGMKPLFLCQASHFKFPHLTSSSISVTGNKCHKPQRSVRRPCSHH